MCQWGVAMMYRTSGHKGPSPQRHKPTKECQRIVPSPQPSPTIWGNQCGLDDRDWHTQPRRDHCSQEGRTTIDTCCVPRPRHPHREAMHTQHTEPGPSCCVPFGDPHVHKVAPSDETRQGAATAAQTHWGQSTIWRGHTRPTTSPKEGKKKGVHQQRVLC